MFAYFKYSKNTWKAKRVFLINMAIENLEFKILELGARFDDPEGEVEETEKGDEEEDEDEDGKEDEKGEDGESE